MIKHAQTSCLSVFDNFVGLVLKELTIIKLQTLLTTFWPDLTIVTIFPQNLILLFQLYVNGWTFIQHHGDLIWNWNLSESETLDMFKSKIQKWSSIGCPLPVAYVKSYISDLGFINQIGFFILLMIYNNSQSIWD